MLGSGTTIAYGTTAWSASVLSIDSLSVGGEAIDTSHLTTSNGATPAGKTFVPGKLYEIDAEITVIAAPGTAIPVLQSPETITITFPDSSTISFSGFNTRAALSSVANDAQITASVTIKGTTTISGLVDHS